MKKAIKAKWLAELRSGAWVQTRGKLFDEKSGGFCCLGVLRELLPEKLRDTENDLESLLTKEQEKYVGLGLMEQDKLAGLNDVSHYNFSKIADYIEKNL